MCKFLIFIYILIFIELYADVAQLVEHQPSKLRVVGSSLIIRSYLVDLMVDFK